MWRGWSRVPRTGFLKYSGGRAALEVDHGCVDVPIPIRLGVTWTKKTPNADALVRERVG